MTARLFSDLSLLPSTLAVLHDMLGFTSMTPVQSSTLPLFLGHKDVVVEACTGSGKTIAYLVPIVERLQRLTLEWPPYRVGAVVLVPTRELATQIYGVASLFCSGTPLIPYLATGGSGDVGAELAACSESGANLIIATPGRLLDFLRRGEAGERAGGGGSGSGSGGRGGSLTFKSLEVLVLDEADTLLELGFAETLTAILGMLPKQRRTGLFSATQTQEVKALARAGLRNPAVVTVKVQRGITAAAAAAGGGGGAAAPPSSQSTPHTLTNFFTICSDPMDKVLALGGALREAAARGDKVIVFFLTCASVDMYGKLLGAALAAGAAAGSGSGSAAAASAPAGPTATTSNGGGGGGGGGGVRAALGIPVTFPILPLHGQMVPKKRTGQYAAFCAAPSGALLCTDVAARGIDLPDVTSILQFDPPQDPSFFIHRVGRTARAGRTGTSTVFLLPAESAYVHLLEVRGVPIRERPRASYLPETTPSAAAAAAAAASTSTALVSSGSGSGSGSSGSGSGESKTASAVLPVGTGAGADPPPPSTTTTTSTRTLLLRAMQEECLRDRAVLEQGTRAYVSYMRGYKEHVCKLIFRLESLDAGALGESFGCVKLPKVEELRGGKRIAYAGARPDVRTRDVAYKDPKREAARQAALKAHGEEIAAGIAARDGRREKAMAHQQAAAAAAAAGSAAGGGGAGAAGPAAPKRKRSHKGANSKIQEEWDLLAREERLEKRMKKGKCSKAEYKKEMREIHRSMGITAEEEESFSQDEKD